MCPNDIEMAIRDIFPDGFISYFSVLWPRTTGNHHGCDAITVEIPDKLSQTDNCTTVADTILDVEDAFGPGRLVIHVIELSVSDLSL